MEGIGGGSDKPETIRAEAGLLIVEGEFGATLTPGHNMQPGGYPIIPRAVD